MRLSGPELWDFSQSDLIKLVSGSVSASARQLAKIMSRNEQYPETIPVKTEALVTGYLSTLKHLSQAADANVSRWCGRYLNRLENYAIATDQSVITVLARQCELIPLCQSVISIKSGGSGGFFIHLEENFEDSDLKTNHRFLETELKKGTAVSGNLYAKAPRPYRYRVVLSGSGNKQDVYFRYPYQFYGGNAFGSRNSGRFFQFVDYLYLPDCGRCLFNINMLAAIFFDIADIGQIEAFIKYFRKMNITVDGGYAFHFIDTEKMFQRTVEIHDNSYLWFKPFSDAGSDYLVQVNYPLADILKSDCLLIPSSDDCTRSRNVLWYWEMYYRRLRLQQLIKTLAAAGNLSLRQLKEAIADPFSETETVTGERIFVGLVTRGLAAYTGGHFSPGKVTWGLGKYAPPPWDKLPYRRFWDDDDPVCRQIALTDLSGKVLKENPELSL